MKDRKGMQLTVTGMAGMATALSLVCAAPAWSEKIYTTTLDDGTKYYGNIAPGNKPKVTIMGGGGGVKSFTDNNGVRHYTNIGSKGTSLTGYSSRSIFPRNSGRAAKKPFNVNEKVRSRYRLEIESIALRNGLEPQLIDAVISAESGYNPKAVSSAGARGLMQLMPATAERFGVSNSFDPVQNMNGGAKYLRILLKEFKSMDLAVAGYNAGEGAVRKYGNNIPPYPETQTYVGRVMQFYQHYKLYN